MSRPATEYLEPSWPSTLNAGVDLVIATADGTGEGVSEILEEHIRQAPRSSSRRAKRVGF
jgi:hypothetical protein